MAALNIDPNCYNAVQQWVNNQHFLQTNEDHIIYKGKQYPLSLAYCTVTFKNQVYIAMDIIAAEIPAIIALDDSHYKLIGRVYRNKNGEKDLSDTPEDNTKTVYGVYKKRRQLFVEVPGKTGELLPIFKIK